MSWLTAIVRWPTIKHFNFKRLGASMPFHFPCELIPFLFLLLGHLCIFTVKIFLLYLKRSDFWLKTQLSLLFFLNHNGWSCWVNLFWLKRLNQVTSVLALIQVVSLWILHLVTWRRAICMQRNEVSWLILGRKQATSIFVL